LIEVPFGGIAMKGSMWLASALVGWTGVCGGALGQAHENQGAASPASNQTAAPNATPLDARFLSSEIEMPLDAARPVRVIPVRLAASAAADGVVPITSDNPGVVSLSGTSEESGAKVLAGQTIGYALVRVVGVGEARLRCGDAGGAGREVKIRVVEGKSGDDAGAFGVEPRLLSPVSGAGVWGKVSVSVATWRSPSEDKPSLRLRVGSDSDAASIEPAWLSTPDKGPLMLASFEVDFGARSPGTCTLWAERTIAGARTVMSRPVVVHIVAPDPALLKAGECETDYKVLLPDQFGPPKMVRVSKDATASGGAYFDNAGAEPRFRYMLDVPSEGEHGGAGWYQVMMTAGGDEAGGALPSIGITIDEAQRPLTASAISQPKWHRTPIGTPVRLEPGSHILRCDFVNDFYAPGGEKGQNADRNLRLDRVEVLRVADASEPSGAGHHGSDSAMTMQTMASQGGGGGEMMMQGGSGSVGAGSSWPASARAATHPPVRVAFERVLDGMPICGEVEIRGTVWWEDQRNAPPPVVALIINGREAQRQRSDSPRFIVPPERFMPGENRISLRAIADGGYAAETAEQRITLPASLAISSSEEHARDSRRFTIYDGGWSPAIEKSLKENQGGEQRKSAPIAQGSSLTLELPEDLHGEFDVFVECRSNIRPGGQERRLDVALISGAAEAAVLPARPVAGRTVPHWSDAHKFTETEPLTLFGGPKRLVLQVAGVEGKGDKNAIWVQGVRLVERTGRTEKPGLASLAYPAQGQTAFGADALVANVESPTGLDWAEAVIDGTPTGLRFDLHRSLSGIGRVLVPISLRGLAPGDHRVALHVSDMRGRVIMTDDRTVRVLADSPAEETSYERAVIVLDRFAYGPDSRQLGEILVLGPQKYLETKLAGAAGDDFSEGAARDLGMVKFTNSRGGYDVARRAIQEAIATANPVRNRFTLWAENHFSTWIRKDEAQRKWDEHERFMAIGVPRFYDLLLASSTSPAMLRYLDQERSYAGKLNENYAREIMELHTLGVHGGYSQQDVTNLAHVLTGWTTARIALASLPEGTADEDGLVEEFRYEPLTGELLDKNPRDVIGYRFAASTKDDRHERVLLALEMLSAHPSTAKFVCTKLANHYVGVPPPAELIDDLASEFTRSGGDMKRVLLAMSRHPAFWAAVRGKRLSHPTDYAFRLARTSGSTGWMNPHEIGDFLGNAGQGLFDRPTPDGFPELDTEAMDSNAILQRWKLASHADGAMAEGIPPALRWSQDPYTAAQSQQVVDILALRLTGRLLGESSNTEALKILEQAAPPNAKDTPVDQKSHDAQVRTCAAFIAQLPEANIR
jgi:uncharacterized protein (DUF1800 family)